MFLWTSFAFIAITLRLYTRVFIVKRVGLDDWLMAGAMVRLKFTQLLSRDLKGSLTHLKGLFNLVRCDCLLSLVNLAIETQEVALTIPRDKMGTGTTSESSNTHTFSRSMYKTTQGRQSNANQCVQALFATVPLYNCTQTLYKLSITTQSYRLFTTTAGKRSLQLLIVWICMCSVMTISGSLFYCLPVPKAWDDSVVGHCVDRSALNYAVSGFNIVNDLTLLFIPVPFLLKLQIQQKQKVVLLSVFACGAMWV